MTDEEKASGAWAETLLYHRKNVFFGHNLESDEKLVFDHGFLVNGEDIGVVGWRATVEIWIRRWNWFMQPVRRDSWVFASTVIVPNPNYGAVTKPASMTG
jgi:hypothetical protein